jgi:hypothetical protein
MRSARTKHTRHSNRISSPSSKCFPTARPAAGKGFLLCMGSLVSLDMLHTPNIRGQCKSICRIEEADGASFLSTDLKRLLQYLHGRVLGFCCRISPFSSAVLDGGDASIDWSGSMAQNRVSRGLGYREGGAQWRKPLRAHRRVGERRGEGGEGGRGKGEKARGDSSQILPVPCERRSLRGAAGDRWVAESRCKSHARSDSWQAALD